MMWGSPLLSFALYPGLLTQPPPSLRSGQALLLRDTRSLAGGVAGLAGGNGGKRSCAALRMTVGGMRGALGERGLSRSLSWAFAAFRRNFVNNSGGRWRRLGDDFGGLALRYVGQLAGVRRSFCLVVQQPVGEAGASPYVPFCSGFQGRTTLILSR